jgi:two-component system, NarL family, nitrate/nitrite response regulator NarL
MHMTERISATGGTGADAGRRRPSLGGTGLAPAGTDAGGTVTRPPAREGGGRPPVTIVVVDDSDVFRRGMVRAIEACEDLVLVGEADGGESGIEVIERLRPDLALLDLRMPGVDGMDVLERLRESGSDTRVLLISATLDDDVEREARARGAAACMSKAESRADICTAAVAVVRR